MIDLGGLPGSTSLFGELNINDSGQVIGFSVVAGGYLYATEWSGGVVINLGEACLGLSRLAQPPT